MMPFLSRNETFVFDLSHTGIVGLISSLVIDSVMFSDSYVVGLGGVLSLLLLGGGGVEFVSISSGDGVGE